MRRLLLFILILHFVLLAGISNGQQFMLVENPRNLRNFKYYPGDDIRLRIKPENRIIEGVITGLNDSMLFIGDWEVVMIKDIRYIYRERFGIMISRGVLLVAGIGYISLDSFNRLINNDAPVILMETLAISAGLVGLNFLLIPFRYKRIDAEKWAISYIDFGDLYLYRLTAP